MGTSTRSIASKALIALPILVKILGETAYPWLPVFHDASFYIVSGLNLLGIIDCFRQYTLSRPPLIPLLFSSAYLFGNFVLVKIISILLYALTMAIFLKIFRGEKPYMLALFFLNPLIMKVGIELIPMTLSLAVIMYAYEKRNWPLMLLSTFIHEVAIVYIFWFSMVERRFKDIIYSIPASAYLMVTGMLSSRLLNAFWKPNIPLSIAFMALGLCQLLLARLYKHGFFAFFAGLSFLNNPFSELTITRVLALLLIGILVERFNIGLKATVALYTITAMLTIILFPNFFYIPPAPEVLRLLKPDLNLLFKRSDLAYYACLFESS